MRAMFRIAFVIPLVPILSQGAETGEMSFSLPEGTTVSGMISEVSAMGDKLTKLPPFPVVAVNEEYATEERLLDDGDIVAFIPPVAGG